MIMMDAQQRELFKYECANLLMELDYLLMEAERGGAFESGTVAGIFRVVHTLKGSCAMMGLKALSAVSHSLESVMSAVRDRGAALAPDEHRRLADALIAYSDYMKRETARAGGGEDAGEDGGLAAAIDAILADMPQKRARDDAQGGEDAAHEFEYHVRVRLRDCQGIGVRVLILKRQLLTLCAKVATLPQNPHISPELGDAVRREGVVMMLDMKPEVPFDKAIAVIKASPFYESHEITKGFTHTKDMGAEQKSRPAEKLVGVNQGQIEELTDLMGELLTCQSVLEERLGKNGSADPELSSALSSMRNALSQAREKTLAFGMVEIGAMYMRMRRIVRAMTESGEKRVSIALRGGELKLDRSVMEALTDPLMHIIRNAVDHGIEPAGERERLGKPAEGVITIEAVSRNDRMTLIISDDGRGVDRRAVLYKAAQKGLLKVARADCDDDELLRILTHPGFSTNAVVTEHSGRGVGLDVAKRAVDSMNGGMSIKSVRGVGTSITISFPTSLAIMDAVEARIGGEKYLLPVAGLGRVERGGSRRVTIYAPDGQSVRAEEIGEIEPVLTKPLPDYVKRMLGERNPFLGCTLLGSGDIRLIIDTGRLSILKAVMQ